MACPYASPTLRHFLDASACTTTELAPATSSGSKSFAENILRASLDCRSSPCTGGIAEAVLSYRLPRQHRCAPCLALVLDSWHSVPPRGCRATPGQLFRRQYLRLPKRESCLECSDAAASTACHLADVYIAAFTISTLGGAGRHAYFALDESRPAHPAAGLSCSAGLRLRAMCPNDDGEHFAPYASYQPRPCRRRSAGLAERGHKEVCEAVELIILSTRPSCPRFCFSAVHQVYDRSL